MCVCGHLCIDTYVCYHGGIQKYVATIGLDTSPVAFTKPKWDYQSLSISPQWTSSVHPTIWQNPLPRHTYQDRSSPRVWFVHPNRRWWPWRFRADARVRWCTLCREPWSFGRAWWSSNPKCSAFHLHPLTPHSWKKEAKTKQNGRISILLEITSVSTSPAKRSDYFVFSLARS